MVCFVPARRDEKATDAARYFIHYIVRPHLLSRSIICDRDSRFLSIFGRTVMDRLGVSARHTSGFHQQANGQAERTNQNLRQYLRAVVKHNPDWVAALDTAEMAINNANIPITNFSPYLLNIDNHPCLLPDTHWDAKRGEIKDKKAEEIVQNMQTTWKNMSNRSTRIEESRY